MNWRVIIPSEELLLEEANHNSYNSIEKECSLCGSKFSYGQSTQKYCGVCSLEVKCQECEKVFGVSFKNMSGQGRKRAIDSIRGNKDLLIYCSRNCQLQNHNRKRNKFCNVCKRETSHGAIGCMICHNNNINKIKYCDVCEKETMHNASRCIVCFNKEENVGFQQNHKHGMHRRYCTSCKKVLLHNGTWCSICDPWPGAFNRDEFYSSKFKGISFESLEKEISFDDIDSLKRIPGVWAIWSADKCLEVAQTKDIGKEMLLGVRCIAKGKENSSFSDEEIAGEHPRHTSKYIKYRDISKHPDLVFVLVSLDIHDSEEREGIESHYAHIHKAEFWSPSPNQLR